jgi:hypothetical protein
MQCRSYKEHGKKLRRNFRKTEIDGEAQLLGDQNKSGNTGGRKKSSILKVVR